MALTDCCGMRVAPLLQLSGCLFAGASLRLGPQLCVAVRVKRRAARRSACSHTSRHCVRNPLHHRGIVHAFVCIVCGAVSREHITPWVGTELGCEVDVGGPATIQRIGPESPKSIFAANIWDENTEYRPIPSLANPSSGDCPTAQSSRRPGSLPKTDTLWPSARHPAEHVSQRPHTFQPRRCAARRSSSRPGGASPPSWRGGNAPCARHCAAR